MKTTNYLISKKLKEAGFKGDADCCYLDDRRLIRNGQEFGYNPTICDGESIVDCFSYHLETILEALPPKIENKNKFLGDWQLEITKEWIEYCYYYHCQSDVDKDSMFSCIKLHNESLADAAARLWLKLKQEGLV